MEEVIATRYCGERDALPCDHRRATLALMPHGPLLIGATSREPPSTTRKCETNIPTDDFTTHNMFQRIWAMDRQDKPTTGPNPAACLVHLAGPLSLAPDGDRWALEGQS